MAVIIIQTGDDGTGYQWTSEALVSLSLAASLLRRQVLSKPEAHDLSGSSSRYLVYKVNCGWKLVGGQMFAAMLKNEGCVGLGHPRNNEKHWHFAQMWMRYSNHRAINDVLAAKNHFLDLRRSDVLAAADNELFEPPCNREVSVRVRPRKIACVVPALAQRRFRFCRLVVIAAHEIWPAHNEFALRASSDIGA